MPGMNPSNPPVTERCPNCGSTATPIYTKNRKKQWISCAILAVLSPCLCWVPFCINSCLDTDIQCTQCLKTRKIYNPIIRTEAIIQWYFEIFKYISSYLNNYNFLGRIMEFPSTVNELFVFLCFYWFLLVSTSNP